MFFKQIVAKLLAVACDRRFSPNLAGCSLSRPTPCSYFIMPNGISREPKQWCSQRLVAEVMVRNGVQPGFAEAVGAG